MHMNQFIQALMGGAPVVEKEDDHSDGLTMRQKMMYEMYEKIVDKFGQWNQGVGADGAHYVAVSPFKSEGMVCSNCVFFQGGKKCEIVEGVIEPNAICKLWIINESLLKEKNERY